MGNPSKLFSEYLIGLDNDYQGHIRCDKTISVGNKVFHIVEVYADGLVIQAFALMRDSTREIVGNNLPFWRNYIQMATKDVSVAPSCSIACIVGQKDWVIYNASDLNQLRNDGYLNYSDAFKRYFKRWHSASIKAKAKLIKRTCWMAFSVIFAYMALFIIFSLRARAWTALPLDPSLIMLMGLAITLVFIAILFPSIDVTLPGGAHIKTSID